MLLLLVNCSCNVLVVSDVVVCGLDVEELVVVINYELLIDVESY